MNINSCTLCNLPVRPGEPARHVSPVDVRDGRIVTLPRYVRKGQDHEHKLLHTLQPARKAPESLRGMSPRSTCATAASSPFPDT